MGKVSELNAEETRVRATGALGGPDRPWSRTGLTSPKDCEERSDDHHNLVMFWMAEIWHPQVETAIEDQLLSRYATGGWTTTSAYFVTAYSSDRWDKGDPRRAKSDHRDTD